MRWFGPLLGFVLTIPALLLGDLLDDHFIRQAALGGSVYRQRPSWDLFSFVSTQADVAYYRERGILLAWWTPDSFRIHFFRPLASLVHTAQFRYFGDKPWLMHTGLALLYALLVWLCARLLVKLCSSSTAAGIGVLLFALNDVHANSTGINWGLNTLLCNVLGLFALLMHVRWRIERSKLGLLLSCLAFVLSLLCSEGGVALLAYLVAYALFREQGKVKKRLGTLVPAGTIAAGYLLFYLSQGYGVKASGIYQSPLDDPLGCSIAVLYKTALLAQSQLLSLPPLNMLLSAAGLAGALLGCTAFGGILWLFRRQRSNKNLAFFGFALPLSIVPFALGPIQDRLLLWSGVAAAGVLGELFAKPAVEFGKLQRGAARALLCTNLWVSLVLYVPTLHIYELLERPSQALATGISARNTVMFSGPWDIFAWYPPAIAAEQGKSWPEHFYYFYTGPEPLTIQRTGDRTLLASVEKGWFVSPETERYTRSSRLPFAKGDRVDLELMTATIEETTADGRPLAVEFWFKTDLSEIEWLKWSRQGPVRCQPPALGEAIQLVARLL